MIMFANKNTLRYKEYTKICYGVILVVVVWCRYALPPVAD